MPFSRSDYRNIPSTGIIPEAMVPANQISFAYSFTYNKDFDPRDGLQSSLSGRVILELKDSAGNLKATFDLQETYNIVLLPLAPNLVFYIWNWYANKEKFTATDAEGEPISTLGESSLGVVPSGDSGTSDRTVYVSSKFYSLIFNVDVEAGDVLKIKKHTLSAGTVVAQASLQVATRLGEEVAPALVDGRCGQQFRLTTDAQGKKARMVRSRFLTGIVPRSKTELLDNIAGFVFDAALTDAHISQAEGNILYVLGVSKKLMRVFRSQDEGKTWKQLMREPANLKILGACLAFGGRYIIYGVDAAKKPSYTILKHSQENWVISESGPCTLAPAAKPTDPPPTPLPTSKVNSLQAGEGGTVRLLATDKEGSLLIWTSNDGKAWKQTLTK